MKISKEPEVVVQRSAVGLCLLLGALLGLSVGQTAIGHADDAVDEDSDANDWPTYNRDRTGSRFNSAESTIGTSNASHLKVNWRFPTTAPVSATPVVADDAVYAGDMSGKVYALSRSGALLWSKQLAGSITASATVAGGVVVVGDLSGNLYGLKRANGAIQWQMKPDAHPLAAIFGSPVKIGKYVAIGVSSNEENAAGNPSYPCCSTRGSLVMVDPKDGSVAWRTFMISDAERAQGSSGASIWSTPTYDPSSKLIYVTTGNNFSQPTTALSDAIVAVDARNGAIVWANQRTANDEWTFHFPTSAEHPDFDFGDSAQVYKLPNGRKVVGAGQKSGFYHVVDAATGVLVNQNQVEVNGPLGGLFADSAVANGIVFANGINWPTPGVTPPVAGDLYALSGDSTQVLWHYSVPFGPILGGVAVANSVVYFTATYSQRLFALSATTGSVLAAIPIGVSASGPSVSRGQVYVGGGDALSVGFGAPNAPGAIIALGL
jgi:polyvinyl alcohol dehydrogenase (cytochrome)